MVQTLLVPVGFGNSGLQKCNGAWFLKLLHATMYFIIISSKIISETNAVDFFYMNQVQSYSLWNAFYKLSMYFNVRFYSALPVSAVTTPFI